VVDVVEEEKEMEDEAGLMELMVVEVEESVSACVISCLSFAYERNG